MAITREVVANVALLARLQLSQDELVAMTEQLDQIVHYVEQLGELDTADVEPMAHVADLVNVLADDIEQPSLSRDEALANAPARDDECYRVPAVLGD